MIGGVEIWKAVLTLVGSVVGAYLLYRGATRTAGAAKDGVARTARVDEQQSALEAWKGLLKPYQDEVERLTAQVAGMRETHDEEATSRREHDTAVQEQLTRQSERIDVLTIEVKHWKTIAKSMARWATTLRDQILHLGGTVPQIPDELLIAQLLDDDDL